MPLTPQALEVTNTGQPIVIPIEPVTVQTVAVGLAIQLAANQTVTITPVTV